MGCRAAALTDRARLMSMCEDSIAAWQATGSLTRHKNDEGDEEVEQQQDLFAMELEWTAGEHVSSSPINAVFLL